MSRIGKLPVTIEEGVEVSVKDSVVSIKGPKGELTVNLSENVKAEIKGSEVEITRVNDAKQSKSDHGTFRVLIANAVKGVKDGFEKKLELVGVGYRAKEEGGKLVLSLGLNHPIEFEMPEGIELDVPEETKITIKGIDKQLVGEVTARIRETRKPEPYKGKGIRYEGEHVRRKSAKSSLGAE